MACHIRNQNMLENFGRCIRENFEAFSESDEFLKLSYSCLKEIISKNDLIVSSEKVVFDAALKWVKASPSERQDKLTHLLSEVRMTYLPGDYLVERVASDELLSISRASRDLIEKVREYHLKPIGGSECVGLKTVPRNYMKHVLYAVCSYQNSGLSLSSYDSSSDEWRYLSSFECAKDVLHVTATKNKIFIFLDQKIGIFHLDNHQWKLLETEHEKIGGASVVVWHENMIFSFGSSHDHESHRIRCFDTRQNTWSEERRMKNGRCYPAAASLGEYIVLTGGYTGSSNLNTCQKYNPSTDDWSELSSMLTPRFGHGCVNVMDKIYVCGGFDKISQLRTAEVYDTLINEWKFISSMKTPRQFFSFVPHNLKIYAIGGMTEGYDITRDIEVYDPKSDQWQSRLPALEGFQFAVSVPTICIQNVRQSGDVP